MAATYLGRLAGYVADQVPGTYILQLTALLLPGIMVKTFTMAVLLAALLAFGRLSSDSEIVALRAGGASIVRIVRSVVLFSVLIAIVTFWFDETVVPNAAVRSKQITDEISKKLKTDADHPVAQSVMQHFKLAAFINAKSVNPATKALRDVRVTAFSEKGEELFTMHAKEMIYNGPEDWRVQGGATLVSPDFSTIIKTNEIWPRQLPKLDVSFDKLTTGGPPEFDLQSMAQMKKTIDEAYAKGDMSLKDIRNWEFGYWNKLSVPLAAIIFGTLGSVLGIRNHRTGTAAGFALAVAIIFGYVTLANFMNVWAMSDAIPAYAASFAPLLLGIVSAGIIMWRRNG